MKKCLVFGVILSLAIFSADAQPDLGCKHEVKFAKSLPAGGGAAWRDFLEDGGVLIVPLIASPEDFAGASEFCDEKALPSFRPQKGPSSERDLNVTAGSTPIFDWPNLISPTLQAGNGRLQISGEALKKWEVVQNGYTMLLRVGRGLLILSTHTCADTPALRENIAAQLQLEKSGIRFAGFGHSYDEVEEYKGKCWYPALGGGKTTVKLRNSNYATTNLNLAARLILKSKDDKRLSRTFVARRKPSMKIGEALDFSIEVPPLDIVGNWTAKTEIFEWDGEKSWVIDEIDVVFPDLIEIVPPDYRSTVSTERREAGVYIGIKANRVNIDMGGMKWKLAAKDSSGKIIASADGVFYPETKFTETKLPVAKDAPAGRYTLEAEVETPCDGVKFARSEFFIVAPEKGQIIVDQDGFYLNEGKPYFPLGIYHCHGRDMNVAIDETGLKPTDMGFNWMQMWDFDWRMSYSLDRYTVSSCVDKKLTGEARERAIDAMIASNKQNRAALKGIVVCLEGFRIWNNVLFEYPGHAGTYSFERNERFPKEIKAMSEDPDQIIRMWYLADEAGGNQHKALRRGVEWFKKHDPKLHPVFNLGNFPAVMAGDVGGVDIYVRYYGGLGEARRFATPIASLRKQYARYHRRPFMVPQAFGQSKSQHSESPDWVRMETYASIIHGVNGIGFYCWKQTGDWDGKHAQGMGWNPATAHVVKKLIAEVKVLHLALRVPGQKNLVSFDGNINALLCGDKESGRYLIAVNLLEMPVDTAISVPEISKLKLTPMFGAPEAKFTDGGEALAVKLPKWGTAVWKVE